MLNPPQADKDYLLDLICVDLDFLILYDYFTLKESLLDVCMGKGVLDHLKPFQT